MLEDIANDVCRHDLGAMSPDLQNYGATSTHDSPAHVQKCATSLPFRNIEPKPHRALS
jgi:hypothetical protein